MRTNWQYMLLALALSVIAWYFVSGREKVETWVELPVQLSGMPQDLVVRTGLPNKIDVRIRGPKGLIHALDEKTLVYGLDLSNLKVGQNVLSVNGEGVPLSSNFEVMEFKPSRLQLEVDKLLSKAVPVEPVWDGELDPDFVLIRALAEPDRITIRGPEKIVDPIKSVKTQVVTVEAPTPGVVGEEAPLDLPEDVEAERPLVMVRLEFGYKTKKMSLKIPVTLVNNSALKVISAPGKVRLQVEMPLPLVRDNSLAEKINASIVIGPEQGPGIHNLPIQVSLPQGGRLLAEPDPVEVVLEE